MQNSNKSFLVALVMTCAISANATRFVGGFLVEKVDRIAKQERLGDSIVIEYESGCVKTNALFLPMTASTKAQILKLSDERATLESAKALVKRIKAKHGGKVENLSDADVLASAEAVFDDKTTSAASAIIAALLGAGAASVLKDKKKK